MSPLRLTSAKHAGSRPWINASSPGVNHAFNNDTSNRYDKPAADLAWGRTVAFLKQELG